MCVLRLLLGVCFFLFFVYFCSFKPSIVSAALATLVVYQLVLICRDSDVKLL